MQQTKAYFYQYGEFFGLTGMRPRDYRRGLF
jgi:hypothetical protein